MSVFILKLMTLMTLVVSTTGCTPNADHRKENHVRGNRKERIKRLAGDIDVSPSTEVLERGRVLISYSDCFACHKESDKKLGPAFGDIAARYPMNSTYIQILAKRIILGNKGSWGKTVMPPHATISEEDAETMVTYILSLNRD